MVQVDGHAMRVQVLGLEGRRAGTPVVVLESGVTNTLEVWRGIPAQLAQVAPVIAYDRAGVGRSQWDSVTPTPQHAAAKLRRLLKQIGADPPYVLVGYSWGGVLARYYAGYNPGDVAGLVFVDPGPIVTESRAESVAPFDSVGAGRAGYEASYAAFGTLLERAPAAIRAEFEVLRGLMQKEPAERDLRPLPPVPTAVVLAGKYLPLPMQLPYDPRAHFEVDLRHRIRALQEWALTSPQGTVVVSNTTTHAITREDPELVVWAVRRVLAAVGNRR
ncbi:MAG TPA: alpha/beta hydrolase [Gemmatimonadaceae bacterium]|nr:alpha/beta hydrolase [Gemmatimonadaceae bacterium]